MELTRRDAVLALVGGGMVASTRFVEEAASETDATVEGRDLDTLKALAETLYPSSVEVTNEFLEAYVLGRRAVDEDYLRGTNRALDAVRTTSRQETGLAYTSLDPGSRDAVLRATGADRAYPDPDGTVAQRVRYYVVDGLLYPLYTTPKGASLVGNGNPEGYPGGTEAYQRPPAEER